MSMSVQAPGLNYVKFRERTSNIDTEHLEERGESKGIQKIASAVDALKEALCYFLRYRQDAISLKEYCVGECKLMAKDAMMFAPENFVLATTAGRAVFLMYLALDSIWKIQHMGAVYFPYKTKATFLSLKPLPTFLEAASSEDVVITLLAGAAAGSAVSALGVVTGLVRRNIISRLS